MNEAYEFTNKRRYDGTSRTTPKSETPGEAFYGGHSIAVCRIVIGLCDLFVGSESDEDPLPTTPPILPHSIS